MVRDLYGLEVEERLTNRRCMSLEREQTSVSLVGQT